MILPLRAGLQWLTDNRIEADAITTDCWNSAGVLRKILRAYIAACEEHPDADIEASR
jgi:hypothetical protein